MIELHPKRGKKENLGPIRDETFFHCKMRVGGHQRRERSRGGVLIFGPLWYILPLLYGGGPMPQQKHCYKLLPSRVSFDELLKSFILKEESLQETIGNGRPLKGLLSSPMGLGSFPIDGSLLNKGPHYTLTYEELFGWWPYELFFWVNKTIWSALLFHLFILHMNS